MITCFTLPKPQATGLNPGLPFCFSPSAERQCGSRPSRTASQDVSEQRLLEKSPYRGKQRNPEGLRETVFSLPREGIYFRGPTMFCSVELQSDLQVDRRIWIYGNNDFAYTQRFCCLILVDNLNMKSDRQGHFRLSKTKQNTFLLKIFNKFVQLLLKLYSLGFHIERRAHTVGGKKFVFQTESDWARGSCCIGKLS